MAKFFIQGASDVLDYKWDFAALTNGNGNEDWLGTAETISAATVNGTSTSGLTISTHTITDSDKAVSAWLSGGTVGSDYLVSCKITTSDSRVVEKSLKLMIRDETL